MAGTRSRQRAAVGICPPTVVPGRTVTPVPQRRPGPSVIPALLGVLLLLVVTGCGSGAAGGSGTPQAGSTTGTDTGGATSSSSAAASSSSSPSTTAECTASSAIAELPLRERLAQLLVVGVPADSADAALSVVRTHHVGGLFLTGDATALLANGGLRRVQQAAPIDTMIAVDDEGGRVQRIAELAGPIPSAREMAATMSPKEVHELALRRGKKLASYGVTMNYAPVLDVSAKPANSAIGDRSFSNDPEEVTEYAGAFARGLRDAGIVPTFKHFPGQGHAEGDSHKGVARTPPLEQLRQNDLVPYRQLLGGESDAAVLLGHLTVPGLTSSDVPASISPEAVRLLRDDLGFDGLIVTDDLYAMDAIRDRYTVGEAVEQALDAGVDMALTVSSKGLDGTLDYLEKAVSKGSLSESRVNDAVAHVLEAKHVDPCALN